jgi:hypothetical protein
MTWLQFVFVQSVFVFVGQTLAMVREAERQHDSRVLGG